MLVPARPRRGPLRRLLETRGVIGRHHAPHVTTKLTAADGTRLTATYLRTARPDAPAVVLAHGFASHRRKPSYALLADVLAERLHVLTIDLRGHGQSEGVSTLGDREALDVAAGVAWLRRYGHTWVAACGLSMGGTSVLHAAASERGIDAVVAISTPATLVPRTTGPMAVLHDVWTTPWKRQSLQAITSIRVVAPRGWRSPLHPVEAAAAVDTPVLVVHGEDDHYFPFEEAEAIHAAAAARVGDRAVLWREPVGFGHAEDGITVTFARALARAIEVAATTGSFAGASQLAG